MIVRPKSASIFALATMCVVAQSHFLPFLATAAAPQTPPIPATPTAAVAAVAPAKPVSMAEVTQMALSKSTSVRKADLKLVSAKQKNAASAATSGPSVQLSSSISDLGDPALSGTVRLQMSLSNTKRLNSSLDAAKSDLDYQQALVAVRIEVHAAYGEVLKARAQVAVSQEREAVTSNMHLPIARLKRTQGSLTQAALVKVQDQLKSAQLDVKRRRTALANAIERLARATGTSAQSWKDVLLETPTADEPLPAADLDGLQALALKSRGDIARAESSVKGLEVSVSSAVASGAPSVSASARNGGLSASVSAKLSAFDPAPSASVTLSEPVSGPSSSGAVFGLGFDWAIFDSGARKALVAAARADLESGQIALEETRSLAVSSVANAYAAYELAQAELALSRSSLASSEEASRIAALQAKQGSGSQLAAREAKLALLEAQASVTSAVFAAISARDTLMDAVGVGDKI